MITQIEIDTAVTGCGNHCELLDIVQGPDIHLGNGEIMRTFRCRHVEECERIYRSFEKANNDGEGISKSI